MSELIKKLGRRSYSNYMTLADFQACPMWVEDADKEDFIPVEGVEDLPEDYGELMMAVTFVSQGGSEFPGYVSGANPFHIGIYWGNDQLAMINRNLPEENYESLLQLSGASGETMEQLSILKYQSWVVDQEGKPREGVFHIPFRPAD